MKQYKRSSEVEKREKEELCDAFGCFYQTHANFLGEVLFRLWHECDAIRRDSAEMEISCTAIHEFA